MSTRRTKRRPRSQTPTTPATVPVTVSPQLTRRADLLGLSSLLLLQLLFWWRAALLQGYLLISDSSYFFEPAKSCLHQSLRAGRLALWSPYLYSGYPLGAEGQVATFYPPSLLFSWLLDGGGAVNWLLISHLMLAAAGMYVLARRLGLSPFAAWLAGAAFSFSGYFFAHVQHVSLICAAVWLPLLIYFVERAWQERTAPFVGAAALVWAAMALAGHPQTLFLASLTMLFWVCWRAAQDRRRSRRWPMARGAQLLAGTFALGLGVAAVQLLLTRDLSALAPHGDRGSLAYVTSFSLTSKQLFGLLSPNWQGSPAFADYRGPRYYWEYVLYVGLLPLLLAVVGAANRRGWTLAGLAVGSLMLALAAGNPLYEVLRYLPGFADFRVPARFIYPFTFAACLLAGLGWDLLAPYRQRLKRAGPLLAGLVAIVVLADLWLFDRPLSALTASAAYRLPNPVAEIVRQEKAGWGRIVVVPPVTITADWTPPNGWAVNPDGWAEARMLLASDVAQSYDLRSVSGYAGFEDEAYNDLFRTSGARLYAGQPELLSLLGVRYLFVTDQSITLPGLASTPIGPLALYRNPGAFPRAFCVANMVSASSREEARTQTLALAGAGQLRTRAVVRGAPGIVPPRAGATATVAHIDETRPEQITVHASATGDALLVLNERWDPGWRAYVDGKSAPLVEVDSVLMGAPLPNGEHTVEFRYQPRGLAIGLPISFASLALCLGLIVLPAFLRRR